jgi:hypothetical protein
LRSCAGSSTPSYRALPERSLSDHSIPLILDARRPCFAPRAEPLRAFDDEPREDEPRDEAPRDEELLDDEPREDEPFDDEPREPPRDETLLDEEPRDERVELRPELPELLRLELLERDLRPRPPLERPVGIVIPHSENGTRPRGRSIEAFY